MSLQFLVLLLALVVKYKHLGGLGLGDDGAGDAGSGAGLERGTVAHGQYVREFDRVPRSLGKFFEVEHVVRAHPVLFAACANDRVHRSPLKESPIVRQFWLLVHRDPPLRLRGRRLICVARSLRRHIAPSQDKIRWAAQATRRRGVNSASTARASLALPLPDSARGPSIRSSQVRG